MRALRVVMVVTFCLGLAVRARAQSVFSIDGVTEDGGADLELQITVEPQLGTTFTGTLDVFDCSVTDLTFTWLHTDCSNLLNGVPDIFELTVNGTIVATPVLDPGMTCSCTPPVRSFTVPLATVQAELIVGTNQIGFSKYAGPGAWPGLGGEGALSWVYAEVTTQGGTERIELFDQPGGSVEPSYDQTDLCANSYTFGAAANALDSTSALPDQAAVVSTAWNDAPDCANDISGLAAAACYWSEITADDGVAPIVAASSSFQVSTETNLAPNVCPVVPSAAQRRCLRTLHRSASKQARKQARADVRCLVLTAHAKTPKLGVPPQLQTGQACLTNDVRGSLAKGESRAASREAKRCLAKPEQLPDWGYVSTTPAMASAESECVDEVGDAFGADLDAAAVLSATDAASARCQARALKATHQFHHRVWKRALRAVRRELRKKAPDPPLFTFELQQRIYDDLNTDAKGTIARATARLGKRVTKACGAADIATVFPGSCAGAADTAELATCLEASARCRVCRSLNGAGGFAEDCDLFDNGSTDGSCP